MVRRKPEPREQAKPVRPERVGPIEPPPTIARLKQDSLAGVWVTCNFCRRSKAISWDALGLPDDLLFPEIVNRKGFPCSGCGGRAVSVTPDWREYRPQGGGMTTSAKR